MKAYLLIVVIILPSLGLAEAQNALLGANWELPGFDPFNTNFNPQTQINNQNVADLQTKWVYQVPAKPKGIGGIAPEGIQTTPMAINGIVYFATGYNRLIALEGSTGREVWSFQPNITSYFAKSWWSGRFATRSLTLHNGILYMQGNDCSIYGLEPTTGELKFSLPDTCKDIPGNTGQYFGVMSPVFYKDILITRSNGAFYGARGFAAGYDLNSKELLWRWYSVPPAGGEQDWGLKDAAKGNINPYKGDWGNSELIGGGTPWGYMAVDDETGLVYTNIGDPTSVGFDAVLRPGPNLFTMSVVALNARTGELVWYYQTAPHDINNHDPVWSVILAKVTINGVEKKVAISASKSNYVYVLDALNGKPVYDPVKIGPPSFNSPNDNAGNSANLTLSTSFLLGKIHCPGQLGGPFAHPAFAYNTIFVSSQNECGIAVRARIPYKDKIIDGYNFLLPANLPQNSTIYAIDASTGKIKWSFFIENRYQSAALTVSGKVLYAVDRVGTFYALDAETGKLLNKIPFNSFGSAGVGIGSDARGRMMLFVATAGAELIEERPGIVVAFGLPEQKVSGVSYAEQIAVAALVVAAVSVVYAVMIVRRSKRSSSMI